MGPFQLNLNQVGKEVEMGLYIITDIDKNSMGALVFGTNNLLDSTVPFDGSPYANARVAARKLAHNGTGDRNKERAYVGTKNWKDTSRGQSREQKFDDRYKKWKRFFDCYH